MLMTDGVTKTGLVERINQAGNRVKALYHNGILNLSGSADGIIWRNAIIEGAWTFTTFMIGATAAQLKADPLSWAYGAAGSFMTGFVGYLIKSYGLGRKKEEKGDSN